MALVEMGLIIILVSGIILGFCIGELLHRIYDKE